jgi:hypothetical protein
MTYIKKPEKVLIPLEDLTANYSINALKSRVSDLSAKKHIPSVAILIEKWENKILKIEKRLSHERNLMTKKALFAKRVNEYQLLREQQENNL